MALLLSCIALITLTLISIQVSSVAAYDPSKREELRVHVVPHSHNDPGWWNTFEDYYQEWTKGIISSVVEILKEEPSRTFIWAEISYFQRWWADQPEAIRADVKSLVKSGQLEFVTAGWVMNDEANTHMIDIIDQLTTGHQWLERTLNTKPKFGWAIDPFGHSPTMPNVLQQMGIEGIVVNRAHRQVKEGFRANKHLEFYWQGESANSSASFNMLTHMLPWKLYDIPNTCGPDWAICATFDFERDVAISITDANVKERSQTLVKMYKEKASLFRHNAVLIPLGDDFKYKKPDITRKMMTEYEKMFKYINSHKELGVTIKFSTLGQYFADVKAFENENSEQEPLLPLYKGDFFTYCDENEDYWSGYFTTRPFMKGLTRYTQSIVRNGDILATLARAKLGTSGVAESQTWLDVLESAHRNVALFQHHDGVTGTARRHVVRDYSNRLFESLSKVAELCSDLTLLVLSDKQKVDDKLKWTTETSTSKPRLIDVTTDAGVIIVFNPLAHPRAEVVSILVNSHNVVVVDGRGQNVATQVDPVWEDSRPSSKKFTIHFPAEVAGIGLTTYFIKLATRVATLASVVEYVPTPSENQEIIQGWNYDSKLLSESTELSTENSAYRIQLTGHGTIKQITKLADGDNSEHVVTKVDQEFLSYSSSGGAYLFLPRGSASPLPSTTKSVRVVTGPLVTSVIAKTDSAIKERIVRLFECYSSRNQKDSLPCPQSLGVEVLHAVDLTAGNTEVVTRFSTDISNSGKFFTDSNGLDMRERQYDNKKPIQGNYYPITSSVFIESPSSKTRLTAISHQAHGVASLKDGQLEIMLDRRLDRDDGRGLGESVTDNVPTVIPLWLIIESVPASSQDSVSRPALSQTASDVWHTRNYPIHTMHTAIELQEDLHKKWTTHHQIELAPLASFPRQLHLLTLAPNNRGRDDSNKDDTSGVTDSDFILRLYRPPVMHSSVDNSLKSFNAEQMFRSYSVRQFKETSLSLLYNKRSTNTGHNIKPAEIVTSIIQLGDKKESILQNQQEITKNRNKFNPVVVEDDSQDAEFGLKQKKGETNNKGKDPLNVETGQKFNPVVEPGTADETPVKAPGSEISKDTKKQPKKHDDNNHDTNTNDYQKENDNEQPNTEVGTKQQRKKGNGGEGRIGGDNLDLSLKKLKDKSTVQSANNTAGLYTTSIVFYITVLIVVVLGGWLVGRRKRNNKDKDEDKRSAPRLPAIWKEREDSMMKLL